MFDKAKKETNLGKLFSKFAHNSTDHIRLQTRKSPQLPTVLTDILNKAVFRTTSTTGVNEESFDCWIRVCDTKLTSFSILIVDKDRQQKF
jgi:hypothetical protein